MSYIGTVELGQMFLGDTEIDEAYLGDTLVFKEDSSPSPYLLPYIRGGSDGSYIDTEVAADNTIRIIVWARNLNPAGNRYTWLFGSMTTNQGSMFGLNLTSTNNTGKMRTCFGNATTDFSNKWSLMSHYHKYELSANGFYVDDTLVGSISAATFSSSFNIHLFGCNNGGTQLSPAAPIDIVACKIYKSGTLVRDFTPVSSPSIGFYDSVSHRVFTNAGQGSFTYDTFDKKAYTPIEYITCSGSSWFDTGIKGANTLNFVVNFTPNVNVSFPNLFGCQDSSSSKRYSLGLGNGTLKGSYVYFRYGSTSKSYHRNTTLNGNNLSAVFANKTAYLYLNYASLYSQSFTDAAFTSSYNIYVGSYNDAGAISATGYAGRIYYLGFGGVRNFVPAKVNGVAGMYDTYNDAFYPSATETAFTAGPEL